MKIEDVTNLYYYRTYTVECAARRIAEGLIALSALMADRGMNAAPISGLSGLSPSAVPQLRANL